MRNEMSALTQNTKKPKPGESQKGTAKLART